jgi:hypothetical protein
MLILAKLKNGILNILEESKDILKNRKDGIYKLRLNLISEEERIRTLLENRYYWGVVLKCLSGNGDHPDLWHARCKVRFVAPKITGMKFDVDSMKDVEIDKLAKYITTTEMTTAEFENYLSEIRNWASQRLDVFIPLPNEYLEDI